MAPGRITVTGQREWDAEKLSRDGNAAGFGNCGTCGVRPPPGTHETRTTKAGALDLLEDPADCTRRHAEKISWTPLRNRIDITIFVKPVAGSRPNNVKSPGLQ